MALLDRDRRRLNRAMPINCDVKLGDIIKDIQTKVEEDGEIDAYTKAETDAKFQPKGEYATTTQLGTKADKGESYTKAESDGKYQTKGTYVSQADFNALVTRVEALENAGDGS